MIESQSVEHVIGTDHFGLVVIGQDVHQTPPVPVVGDAASIVDVTRRVSQNFKGNIVILPQEHFQLRYADFQVSVGELVGYVEP
jgi:hypothetical protein